MTINDLIIFGFFAWVVVIFARIVIGGIALWRYKPPPTERAKFHNTTHCSYTLECVPWFSAPDLGKPTVNGCVPFLDRLSFMVPVAPPVSDTSVALLRASAFNNFSYETGRYHCQARITEGLREIKYRLISLDGKEEILRSKVALTFITLSGVTKSNHPYLVGEIFDSCRRELASGQSNGFVYWLCLPHKPGDSLRITLRNSLHDGDSYREAIFEIM